MDDLDWDEFSAAVRLLKSGVSRLYFRDVINAATGYKIIPFDDNSNRILEEIKSWLDVNLNDLSNLIEMDYVGRPNELGNYLERVLMARLDESLNFSVDMPRTEQGHKQAVGYPDGIIVDQRRNVVAYFDVKIFQEKQKTPYVLSTTSPQINQNLTWCSPFFGWFVVDSSAIKQVQFISRLRNR